MNVVFDTNILISSTLWDNSVAKKLLIKLIQRDCSMFSSNEIILEYFDVLKKQFYFERDLCLSYLDEILSFLEIIKPVDKIDVIKEDPTDNKFLECAIASKSDYIISYDKHLLKLKEFKNIKIITPEEFLKTLKK